VKGQDNPEFKKYLLLDNRIIQKTENVKLEVGKVVKHPNNPLFGEEKDFRGAMSAQPAGADPADPGSGQRFEYPVTE
jgi:hypothetical protein